jgi:homoserine kinase
MRLVKVILPAAITNVGTGLHTLGLAVALHTTIRISERQDTILNVETSGDDAGRYSLGLRHPVVLGMSRIFQRLEKTVLGLNVSIENQIPAAMGIGVETAFIVAGIVAANNLFGNPFSRTELLQMAAKITNRPDQAVTTMLGGLTTSALQNDQLIYRSLPIAPLKVIITLPHLAGYGENILAAVPNRAPMRDALHNINRLPLLLDALRTGDFNLMGLTMDDALFAPYRLAHIPNFEDIVQVAKLNGASAVTLCGSGPALLTFAKENHPRISTAINRAFEDIGVKSTGWVLPVDTQGLVVSMAQTS